MGHEDTHTTLKTLTTESDSFSSMPENFKVFVFQPDEDFFSLPFEERLNILENRILLAKKILQETASPATTINNPLEKSKKSKIQWLSNLIHKPNQEKQPPKTPTPPTGLFVAPEYLFKDLSRLCYERYYVQEQKNEFKNKLKELSLDTDMLIVPGTFCWYKNPKNDSNNYYRNTAYFFHRGHVDKYKKRNPHTLYDFDYTDEGFLNYMDIRRNFFKLGIRDTIIKDFSGIKLGIEICYDSVQGALSDFVKDNEISLNVQLIIADGAEKPTLVNQEGTLFIQVERKSNQTQIGTITNPNDNMGIKPAISLGKIEEEDLTYFKFK